MADTTLTLNGAYKTVTLSTTTVSRIVVPTGTRYLMVSSASDFYHQPDTTQAIADGAAITAANAGLFPAGLWPLRVDGSGGSMSHLVDARYELFYGSTASQSLYVRAVSAVP